MHSLTQVSGYISSAGSSFDKLWVASYLTEERGRKMQVEERRKDGGNEQYLYYSSVLPKTVYMYIDVRDSFNL